jgi:hypothetical protein|tara:strand:+ start:248 stop:622 length:375 start_codon:yes stop_codon:yes gene_type:complete
MTKSSPHYLLFSSLLAGGHYPGPSRFLKTWSLLKKRYLGLNMKFKTLKLLRIKKIARKRIETTEKAILALIIGLALVLILLAGCNYKMVPSETKIEYGTTETDSKNDKLQQKQSITQSWKWKQR